jgi:hypothetical protein
MARTPLRWLVAALALLLPVAVLAGAEPGASAAGPGRTPAGPELAHGAGGWAVEMDGRIQALDLAPGARLELVESFGRGWLAAGTRPAGDRIELLLLADDGDGPRELAPPGDARGAVRERPRPVVAGGALAGVAWLEGDRREAYGVRWAAWRGSGFEAPVEIAAPGPGSQLALAAAALADGRALLVWSGYDGRDDEIWASVGRGDRFTAPARVGADDAVPDVTPDVIATSGGALVAWSHFDGLGYRVTLARFAGDRFETLRAEGPPGSLFPTFVPGGEPPRLIWWDASADGWVAAELTAAGELVARARAEGPADQRPDLTVSGASAVFRFRDRRIESPWR